MNPSHIAPIPRTSLVLATLLLGASACAYETTSVVRIPTVDTAYPVSSSRHYVEAWGAIVRDTEYKVVDRFQFEKTVESPRHDAADSTLRLGPEIDRIIRKANGDAVTGLTIDAVSYDPGSHSTAAFWKNVGWVFTPIGAVFIGAGVGWADEGDKDRSSSLYAVGGSFAAIGVLSFLLAAVLRSPATWCYQVSGQIVKAPTAGPAISPPDLE